MNLSQEVLNAIKSAQRASNSDVIAKSGFTQSTGLVNYDLQAPAKLIYPVITPLRNRIPRRRGNGGTATHWKTVTGINTANIAAGVQEGKRGGVITDNVVDVLAQYAGLGLENSVTFEAEYASVGFDDVRSLAVETTLQSLMIQEEQEIIGGNGGASPVALGTTPTPTLSQSGTGGTFSAGTYSVICVALTNDGYITGSVSGGILASVTRTNADATTTTYGGGSAQKSSNATVVIASGTTNSISATVTAVNGAVAYAWFWGAAGNEVLGAITTINSVVITGLATGSQTAASLPSSDNSVNSTVFQGLLYQIFASGSNSYIATQPTGTAGTGTPLTSDNAGGIVEINTAFRSFWDDYRVSPTMMIVNAQELNNITAKVIASGGAPLFRLNLDAARASVSDLTLTAGTVIGSYLNKFTMGGGQVVPVMLHPNVPAGTIIFYTDNLNYPVSNVRNPLEMRTRQEYYQTEWPLRTRQYEYGVYVDEVLVNYFTPAFGIITNIGNG
jgi:hypothetical protein